MATPGGLVDKTELINAQLDTAHLGRVVNSKDASGAPISTSTNRTGGVNKTLDALEAEYTSAIQSAGGDALNGGVWAVGQTFTAYNQYMVYNGVPYKPKSTTTLLYGPTGATPDFNFVQPYVDISAGDVSNPNLISNSSFEIAGSVANAPDATPRAYNADDELFQGFKAVGALTSVTYTDGILGGAGQLYVDAPKATKMQQSTAGVVASVAGADGKPITTGVTVVDNGSSYRVTFDIANVFSVKLEQGSVATRHELLYSECSTVFSFGSVAEMKNFGGVDTSKIKQILDSSDEIAETSSYKEGWGVLLKPLGGCKYILTTLQKVRDTKSDQTWDPDGYSDHFLFGGSQYVATISYSYETSVESLGISHTNTESENNAAFLAVRDAHKNLVFSSESYKFPRMDFPVGSRVKMTRGGKILLGTGVAPQVYTRDDSVFTDVWFESLNADLNSNRVAIDNVSNLRMTRCSYVGFRNPGPDNAWGVLFSNSSNIILENPRFLNNTQSDIAFTDNNRNITVTHPEYMDAGVLGGVYINFEPNAEFKNEEIAILSAKIRRLDLLYTTRVEDVIERVRFSECDINVLNWKGGNVTFDNTDIKSILSANPAYSGRISERNTAGISLSPNLLKDPYIVSLSEGVGTAWRLKSSNIASSSNYAQSYQGYGSTRRVVLNPTKTNAQVIIESTQNVDVAGIGMILIASTAALDTEGSGGDVGGQHRVYFYQSDGTTEIGNTPVRMLYQGLGDDKARQTQMAFVAVPSGAVFARIALANTFLSSNTNALATKCITMHYVSSGDEGFGDKIASVHDSARRRVTVSALNGGVAQHNLEMTDGDELNFNNELYYVKDGNYVNPSSGQVVPLIAKYSSTDVSQ